MKKIIAVSVLLIASKVVFAQPATTSETAKIIQNQKGMKKTVSTQAPATNVSSQPKSLAEILNTPKQKTYVRKTSDVVVPKAVVRVADIPTEGKKIPR